MTTTARKQTATKKKEAIPVSKDFWKDSSESEDDFGSDNDDSDIEVVQVFSSTLIKNKKSIYVRFISVYHKSRTYFKLGLELLLSLHMQFFLFVF